MTRTLLILLLLAAPLAAEDAAQTVILDENAIRNLRLETAEAEEADFEETVFALGRINVAPGRRSIVSSRVPGRVVSVEAHIDTRIRLGAEALTVESRLPGDPPPRIRLPALISGIVSAVHVVEGQPIEPSDALVEILDLSSVHATAAIPEHLVARVKEGAPARIRVPAANGREFTEDLAHLGTEVDRASGTLEAAFHVQNDDYVLRPGMRAEFSIVTGVRDAVLAVPRAAVQGEVAGRFVWRRHYDTALRGAFVRIPVVTGAMNDRLVEITAGLAPGDEVVTSGAYALAFAGKGSVSLKEALDAAHGHPHNEDGTEMTAEQLRAAGVSASTHSHGGLPPLTAFFAGTTGLLFVLLVALSFRLRHRSAP